ncbi:hypothetical protein [Yersinia kristensenii]|uniref:hypothetical protein n=1 Tax=Yersinia kristensenii TaxID=28152 RepID=UPI0015627741|nr:hypothetical protein [Yersinia kristensenii]QKJ16186.1 hypothetical protein HRD70_13935 [Yersinia kristensenii]
MSQVISVKMARPSEDEVKSLRELFHATLILMAQHMDGRQNSLISLVNTAINTSKKHWISSMKK